MLQRASRRPHSGRARKLVTRRRRFRLPPTTIKQASGELVLTTDIGASQLIIDRKTRLDLKGGGPIQKRVPTRRAAIRRRVHIGRHRRRLRNWLHLSCVPFRRSPYPRPSTINASLVATATMRNARVSPKKAGLTVCLARSSTWIR